MRYLIKSLQIASAKTKDFKDKKFYTLESTSPFAITQEEVDALDTKRPTGLSGHMRAKNEEATLEASIHSVMPALDELVLSVQPSDDKTYQLALKLKDIYKDKINLIYYTPSILPAHSSHIRLDEKTKEILKNFKGTIPSESIHSLAHFYNHGMVRIKYSHYMKVDADQIYLTSKCIKLKEAIKLTANFKKQPNPKTKPLFKPSMIDKLLANLFNLTPKDNLKNHLENSLEDSLEDTFLSNYLAYKNAAFAMGGINIGLSKAQFKAIYKNYNDKEAQEKYALGSFSGPFKNGVLKNLDITKLKLALFSKDLNQQNMLSKCLVPLSNNEYPTYNGSELLLLEVSKDNLYTMAPNAAYEVMPTDTNTIIKALGIFWLHFGLVKRNYFIDGRPFKDYIHLSDYLKASPSFLLARVEKTSPHILNHMKTWHKRDRRYIKELLESSLDSKA
ncbi:hypothetical protein [Helicobacter sp. 11S02629-2]|uniref:hypothetical protein n=1 Tax=Helicobacter sp. 11S02629-2 TaxID=1476195 RepID=UPI000BA57EF0|nr:hypothetical protein [Helicobacter sp. 11S02629-2]PAF45838.1 hypothetical protein BKH40_00020 [Helicobacter sp. 11S02629-2]